MTFGLKNYFRTNILGLFWQFDIFYKMFNTYTCLYMPYYATTVSICFSSWEMFASATRNFVEEVDPRGLLIPVSSLNDTIDLLTVVVKHKRFWFWQKPKYKPTDFNFNDILLPTGDTHILPGKQHTSYLIHNCFNDHRTPKCFTVHTGVTESDFITYNGIYGDNIQGSVEISANSASANANLNLEGKESSKLQSSFGSLKKEEVDVNKLLCDSKTRFISPICFYCPLL